MSTPTGLRERKKQQVRDTLVEVALALFDAHGFDAVTVDQIAERAEVSPRTFFRYFGSKEAVLFADQEEMRALVHDSICARPADEPPLTALREALVEVVDAYEEHRERHLQRVRMAGSGASIEAYQRTVVIPQFEDTLTAVIATRLCVDADLDLRPRLLAGTAMAALMTVGRMWLVSGGAADLNQLLHSAFRTLEDAAFEAAASR